MKPYIPLEIMRSPRWIIELYLRSYYPEYAPCELCDFAKIYCKCNHLIKSEN